MFGHQKPGPGWSSVVDPHYVDADPYADPDSTYQPRMWIRILLFIWCGSGSTFHPVADSGSGSSLSLWWGFGSMINPGSETLVYVANGTLWRAGFVMGLGRSDAQECMWRLLLLCLPQAPPDKDALLARLRHSAAFKGGSERDRERDRADTYSQDPGQCCGCYGPPGSGSVSQWYGFGSAPCHHQANKARKTLIPTVL